MKTLLSVSLIGLALTGAAIANEAHDELMKHCTDKWGADFSMVEYCYDKQMEAALRLRPIVNEVYAKQEPGLVIALASCLDKWSMPSGGSDWTMVEYCWEKQYESYLNMKNK